MHNAMSGAADYHETYSKLDHLIKQLSRKQTASPSFLYK